MKIIFLSIWEAILVLALANSPVILTMIFKTLGDPQGGFSLQAFWIAFSDTYSYRDLFGYLSGLLASTTVFYWMNKWAVQANTTVSQLLSFAPLIVLMLATPLFYLSMTTGIKNLEAAQVLAYVLLALALGVWVASIAHQKVLESHRFSLDGGDESKNISESLVDPRSDK